tara:strand:+ start:2074 stop:3933 length:1860 start_codon:yes stop_codon:yes gene_type:complete
MSDDTPDPKANYGKVIQMMRNAEKVEPAAKPDDASTDQSAAPRAPEENQQTSAEIEDQGGKGTGGGNGTLLPEGCPITPLGTNGDMCFFLDFRGAFRPMTYEKLLRAGPNSLLGPESGFLGWAWRNFVTRNKEGEQTGWSEKNCGRALLIAASSLDVWKGLDRVRGAGCWKAEDGSLVVHLGNKIIVNGTTRPPGMVGHHVYPADDAQPAPWHKAVEDGGEGPADKLLQKFSTWNWERPELDPRLLLGWVCAAMYGGALDWRPSACLTGDQGTGKSTLENAIKNVLGSMVHAADATQASLWTALGYSSLPVALDEFEAGTDDRKSQGLINLMRLSSSGGIILRGSADHKLAQFQARSPFLFSGINPPAMQAQDLSRIAMLELNPLEDLEGVVEPSLGAPELRELGAKIRRRMIDNWHRWPKVLGAYRAALKEEGHNARGCDQFGALMAAADIALWDDDRWSLEDVARLCKQLSSTTLAETANAERQHELCLAYILSAIPDQWSGGEQRTVAQHIRASIAFDGDAKSRSALAHLGMAVRLHEGERYLAVANASHQGAQRLFAGTQWRGGGHQRLLRRLPDVVVPKGSATSIGAVQTRVTLVPIDLCINNEAAKDEEGWNK